MCAAKHAGVACVIVVVVTSPVRRPFARASSRQVVSFLPDGSTAMAPLTVETPQASAVAPAAESVSGSSAGAVLSTPVVPAFASRSNAVGDFPAASAQSMRSPSCCGPVPSPMSRITLFGAAGASCGAAAESPHAAASNPRAR
jgi:hypothetical protein